jgi:glyoxalase family protein
MNTEMKGPHQGQPILAAGRPPAEAETVMILVHRRGGRPAMIMTLANDLYRPDMAYLAPQAGNYTWYPYSFLAPIPQNEPGISSGIQMLADLVAEIEAAGIPAEKIVIGGFSQGACLATEFVARHARRYGGLFALSGGLIGPDGTPRDYAGSLSGTPVFIGCSDIDFHIPLARVHETTAVLRDLGGNVEERIYPGMAHTWNQDELDYINKMMESL